jgi:hypothetical protein
MNIVDHCRLLEQSMLAAVRPAAGVAFHKGAVVAEAERKWTHTYYKCAEYVPYGIFYCESINADFL